MSDMSDILFFVAAGLALIGVLAHELIGAPKVLGPLKESGLADSVIWLHHFSWHVGSVAVLAMITLFLMAVWLPDGLIHAVVATAMSAGFSALGIGLATLGNSALWRTPAPYLWTLITVIGALGLLLENTPA